MSCLQCDKQPSATPSRSVTFGGPADTGVFEPLRFRQFWLKRREPRFAFAKFSHHMRAWRDKRRSRVAKVQDDKRVSISRVSSTLHHLYAWRDKRRSCASSDQDVCSFGSPELFLRASVEEKKRKTKQEKNLGIHDRRFGTVASKRVIGIGTSHNALVTIPCEIWRDTESGREIDIDLRWRGTRFERILVCSHSTQTGLRNSAAHEHGHPLLRSKWVKRQTKDAVDGCFSVGQRCHAAARVGH